MQVLQKTQHPNVVKLIAVIDQYSFVTEYVERGDLFSLLKNKDPHVLWSRNGVNIARGIASGLEYLHSIKIIHRDLKSPNILITRDWQAKISDMGFARIREGENKLQIMTEQRGTILWAAPEIFETNEISDKSDIYSFGLILLEILTQDSPWNGYSPFSVPHKVLKQKTSKYHKIPDDFPKPIARAILSCWEKNPDDRPTAAALYAILNSPKSCCEAGNIILKNCGHKFCSSCLMYQLQQSISHGLIQIGKSGYAAIKCPQEGCSFLIDCPVDVSTYVERDYYELYKFVGALLSEQKKVPLKTCRLCLQTCVIETGKFLHLCTPTKSTSGHGSQSGSIDPQGNGVKK